MVISQVSTVSSKKKNYIGVWKIIADIPTNK